MPIARVKTWTAGEVLTANDLNNEFNNVANTALVEPFVASQPIDLNGQLLILDADGDTLLDGSTNNIVDVTIGGSDDFRFSSNTFTALAGSSIVVDDGDVTVDIGNVVVSEGRVLEADAGNVTAAASITVPDTGHTFSITGTTTITAFSSTQVGVMLYVRFTGAGLNITHNAVSMIAPWGVDYRTITNEVLCFLSLGGGNYTFWSLNGPKEQTGQSFLYNGSGTPLGGLPEDGAAVSRTTYPGLFVAIGTTHGAGDGSTTFNVPDSRGRVDVGVDGSANRITAASTNGGNADTLGGVGGAETHTLVEAEIPALNTVLSELAGGALSAEFTVTNNDATTTSNDNRTINFGGSGGAHSNTQPWIAKKKFIRF